MSPLSRFSGFTVVVWSLVGLGSVVVLADLIGMFGWNPPAWLADRDFANYWIAGRLAVEGQALDLFSGQDIYFPHMQEAFGPDYPWHAWSYPPHYLLFVWPLGLLSYLAAMAAFLTVTLALFLMATRAFLGPVNRADLSIVLPFIVFNLFAVQNGFLSATFMLGALAYRYERPVIAGILAGCLTIKPQLGLLLPLLFLIEGRWTTIVSAALTTILLVVLSAAIFGADSWSGYIGETYPYQREVMDRATGIFLFMMPSVFGALRSVGVPASDALVAHLIVAVPAIAATTYALWRCGDPRLRAAIAIVATFVATPYSLAYDLGAFAAALVLLARMPPFAAWSSTTIFAGALLPVAMVPLGIVFAPVAPLVIVAILMLMLRLATQLGVESQVSRSASSPVAASD